jgi:group I intron endonuclease
LLIYKITNLLNGKIYIGKTIQSLRRRWTGHLYEARHGFNRPICKAIREQGARNFKIEVLAKPDCVGAMNLGEEAHILLNDACGENGYNVSCGGDGFTSEQASAVQKRRWETMPTKERERMVSMLRANASRAGKAASHPKDKTPWNKGLRGSTPWNKGKRGVYSSESLEKMSLAKKNTPNPKDPVTHRFVAVGAT